MVAHWADATAENSVAYWDVSKAEMMAVVTAELKVDYLGGLMVATTVGNLVFSWVAPKAGTSESHSENSKELARVGKLVDAKVSSMVASKVTYSVLRMVDD